MQNLDDLQGMKNLDELNVLGSIEQVGKQCQQAWDDVEHLEFPDAYTRPDNIVFAGMGGSSLGAYIIKSLFYDQINLPFEIVNGYHLPPYVGPKTLVIVCSYSGTTEEAVSAAREAVAKKAMLTGIAVGKTLADVFHEAKVPAYVFSPTYNPSNQPRLGTGYTAYGQIAIMAKLGLIHVSSEETKEVLEVAQKGNEKYTATVKTSNNRAKQLAHKWYEKIPIIVASEFLWGAARVVRNQFHECAKAFAAYHDIQELNHHLMEALTFPKKNKELLTFLFLSSDLYSPPIRKRVSVTKDVVVKQGMSFEEFSPESKTKITQVFECVQFGAYVNYYMSMLYDIDPSKIPWVDYFKAELAKT